MQTDFRNLPCCAFDRILLPPVSYVSNRHFIAAQRKLQRWVMDRSDYLFCYHYKELGYEKRLYLHALQTCPHLIDLTQTATQTFLHGQISSLPMEAQSIKRLSDQGITNREIAGLLHISPLGASQKLRRILYTLHENAKNE